MSYTTYDQLAVIDSTARDPYDRLVEWTDADELGCSSSLHYPEDFILLTNEPTYHPPMGIKKYKANFWGMTWPVWVGHDSGGNPIKSLIVLKCPPFHPPNGGGPGVPLRETDKPDIIVDESDPYCTVTR